jgi:hypothetical protein
MLAGVTLGCCSAAGRHLAQLAVLGMNSAEFSRLLTADKPQQHIGMQMVASGTHLLVNVHQPPGPRCSRSCRAPAQLRERGGVPRAVPLPMRGSGLAVAGGQHACRGSLGCCSGRWVQQGANW